MYILYSIYVLCVCVHISEYSFKHNVCVYVYDCVCLYSLIFYVDHNYVKIVYIL